MAAPPPAAQPDAHPSRSLTIFSLPLELRLQIYTLALSPHPTTTRHLTPYDIHVSLPLAPRHQANINSANYWSSRALQRRLRLLRTHSAVRAEASRALYAGAFTFSFPPWDDAYFFKSLDRWLGAPAPWRACISRIALSRAVTLAPVEGAAVERRWEREMSVPADVLAGPRDFRILATHLKRLRSVVVDVRFHGFDVLEGDFEWAVQRVLALARPFADVPRVELRVGGRDGEGQRGEIVREARRRIKEEERWHHVPKISSVECDRRRKAENMDRQRGMRRVMVT